MSPACTRLKKLLDAGPAVTHQMMEAGGRNFPERMRELREKHGVQWDRRRLSQTSWKYWLTNATPLSAGERPPIDGRWVLCRSCTFRFEQDGPKAGCPRCDEGVHWLEEFHSAADRDRAARRVDPEKVARELAYFERARADRERRAAA